jgi:hypothetical protein
MSIKVFDDWSDFNSIVSYGLRENCLVSLVCNEGGSVLIEYKTSGLTTSREGDFHLAFIHLIDVTICGDSEEVAL